MYNRLRKNSTALPALVALLTTTLVAGAQKSADPTGAIAANETETMQLDEAVLRGQDAPEV